MKSVIGAVVALGVTALLTLLDPDPPSRTAQIDAIKRTGTSGNRYVASAGEYDLHGSGANSYVVTFRQRDPTTDYSLAWRVAQAQSDELRIYDDGGDELTLAFAFQPGVPAAGTTAAPYAFERETVADLDGNGALEIIGSFASRGRGTQPMPIVIYWDDSRGVYRIEPFLQEPPNLVTPKALATRYKRKLNPSAPPHAGIASALRDFYATPAVLLSLDQQIKIRGHYVEDFDVFTSERGNRLLAAFSVAAPAEASSTHTWEIQSWAFEYAAGSPRSIYPCTSTLADEPYRVQRVIVLPPKDFHDPTYLRRQWQKFGHIEC